MILYANILTRYKVSEISCVAIIVLPLCLLPLSQTFVYPVLFVEDVWHLHRKITFDTSGIQKFSWTGHHVIDWR